MEHSFAWFLNDAGGACGGGPGYGFMWMGGGLILLTVFVLLLYYLLSESTRPRQRVHRPRYRTTGPLEVLDHRYARGEISREEYLDMKEDILHRR